MKGFNQLRMGLIETFMFSRFHFLYIYSKDFTFLLDPHIYLKQPYSSG